MLGVIGRNGAGKSTLLKILTRITTPTSGRAEIRGRVGSLLEVGTGFHPELTGRENVFLNGSVLGMKRREIQQKFSEIVEFAGVERFIDTPVKRYSSGMSVRLAFAVAAHLEPEILLVDEVLAVGRRRVPATVSRTHGGPEPLRADGRSSSRTRCRRWRSSATGRSGSRRAASCSTARARTSSPSTSSQARRRGSSRVWPDLDTAPGDDLVRLRSVARRAGRGGGCRCGCSQSGRDRDRRSRSCRIDGRRSSRRSSWWTSAEDVAFNAIDTSSRWHEPTPPGDYVATAWIPGNLLNEGLVSVAGRHLLVRRAEFHHHAGCIDAVSFHVQDPGEGDSARGDFTGQWKGVVRPLLEWTTEER